MKFIGEEDREIDAYDEEAITHRILEFNTEKRDIFLQFKMSWDLIESDVYHVAVGGDVFHIPTGFFVLIGDSYADFDWIPIDEMFNRDIEMVTFDIDMLNWRIEIPNLVDFTSETYYWPSSKHVIPLQENNRVIMLSEKDQYHKLKAHQLDIFTSH